MKPPPTVHYAKRMPDIEPLMQVSGMLEEKISTSTTLARHQTETATLVKSTAMLPVSWARFAVR